MTGHQGDQQQLNESERSQSLTFLWTLAAIVAFASVFTIATALAIKGGNDGPSDRPFVVAGAVHTPIDSTPTDSAKTATPTVAAAVETVRPATSTPSPIASSASVTPTVGSAWTATPAPTPEATSSLSPVAQALAQNIESQYGVRVLTEDQDWGADKDAQLTNIAALGEALASVPTGVRIATAANGPLTFLSNHGGMTEAGWQPYGAREANYYSNEDVSTGGSVAANQVVLQPGSGSQTIAHEIMHAYQMRDIAPGQYALALLTPDMKSFMQATGWTQIGSDDDVRAAAGNGWDGVNHLFQYNGRVLTYTNEFGNSSSLFIPNPLEAYAEAGGLYYGHSDHLTLPDWPDYWDWFRSHLG